jgi:hypothetical protein
LSDINFSIILKIFLKYHITIALEYNLKKIFQNELVCKKKSCDVLESFYKIIKKKIGILFLIKKWQNVYPNKIFWSYDYSIQPEKLVHMKNVFNSIYDCSKGGLPLHCKLGNTLNNYDTRENIKERLRNIVVLVGKDLLKSLDIVLIADCNGTSSEEARLARCNNRVENDRQVNGSSISKDGAAEKGREQEDCRSIEQGQDGQR